MSAKEFELTMRLRNNLIKSKRLALGLKARECAERIGITYGKYLDYEGLRESPLSERPGGERFKSSARRLARFFGCEPDEIWPDAVLAVNKPEVVTQLRADEALALAKMTIPEELPSTPEELLESKAELWELKSAMATLSRRERAVLKARFWDEKTLRGTRLARADGSGEKVCTQQVRSIELRAIRKLRRQLSKNRVGVLWDTSYLRERERQDEAYDTRRMLSRIQEKRQAEETGDLGDKVVRRLERLRAAGSQP